MKNTKSKLSLDQFKAKLGDSKESLEFISGGILGACHDDPDAGLGDIIIIPPVTPGDVRKQ